MTPVSTRTTLDHLGESVGFGVVDVFADRPLEGNPLAVVPDADALPTNRMQAIAAEFNLSETTFLVRATLTGADVRLRSFTAAGHEVGGAGHNALGAWLWLAHTGRVGLGRHHQQIGDDVLAVDVERDDHGRIRVVLAQSAPVFGATIDRLESLVAALGLAVVDVDPTLPVQVVATGAAHLLVPLVDRAAVDRIVVDVPALRAVLAGSGGEGCYVYAAGGEADAYARFFNPTVGIVENPATATGTAAGPLAALLVAHGRVAGPAGVRIDQGYAMGRPSRLHVTVDGDLVRLAGSGPIVAEGRIAV